MATLLNNDGKIIAIDFDGTIVEHKYPAIGKEMLFAFATIKELQKKGHRLILWTFRAGQPLEEAVEFCRKNGVEFYAVNKNYPEEVMDDTISRKINADIFIDDRNVGGFLGWSEIWQQLHPEGEAFLHQLTNPDAHHNYKGSEGKGIFKKLFGK
ncbi:MAG TPA: hydrolase [Bacteroidia bacterium]|jgi:hydroxymethylpyrimidine pyrophosphatase-like HAD family hydrolase|nr:hydrolase [Bacteroidia bacterium]